MILQTVVDSFESYVDEATLASCDADLDSFLIVEHCFLIIICLNMNENNNVTGTSRLLNHQ